MARRRLHPLIAALLLTGPAFLAQAEPAPPRLLLQDARHSLSLLRRPDGGFAFYNRHDPAGGPIALPDRSGVRHPLLPYLPASMLGRATLLDRALLANTQVILTPDHEVISVQVRAEAIPREAVKEAGLSRYLDVWLTRADTAGVAPPRRIWRGYNGSQMEYQQFPDGRIIVPFGSMQPHARAAPPTGRHVTLALLSDDAGRTWHESASRLVSPCYEGFNGNNEGACEPAIEELRDGRLWMLLRTQAGFLYETFSADRGQTWSQATASRFSTSTGPANILRHRDGSLGVAWNNCELPLRHQGQGVYGGRDALHLALSADDGRTWRGFREIYLDFRRNDNPARSGDRGTAYPLSAYADDGRLVVLAGQGAGGRNPILVDPEWLTATTARTDFTDGLEQWSVYKHHGPAQGWWRARAVGATLVPDPANPAAKCLHLRKADALPADAATWNFPNGWKGSLTTRILLRRGQRGAMICLNDRFFDPSEALGQDLAVFRVRLDPDGRTGDTVLASDRWHDLTLEWNLTARECALRVDGRDAGRLPLAHETLNGVSYVRFVSLATELDPAGFLVGSVSVDLTDPTAPAWGAADLRQHERRYVETVVPRWSRSGGARR
jgi:hypothetical protein